MPKRMQKSGVARQFGCLLHIFAALLLLTFAVGLLAPGAVQAAGGDITISGPGLNYSHPGGITVTQGQLQGQEALPQELQDSYGKEYLPQYDEWYSTINTWPTKSWYRGQGVKLSELLDLAGGLAPEATQIKFTSKDGFTVAYPVQDFVNAERYRFPNFMDTGQAGNLPGDASGAVPVETIIAHRSHGSDDIGDITGPDADDNFSRSDANHLLFGQRAVTQQTNARFAKYVTKIEVLTDPAPQWEMPTASVEPGEVMAGTQVGLLSLFNDEDKIHYTLDGSNPTIHSPMYNWVASRWWSDWGDELDEVNRPIEITKDTIIKAFVAGPGRLDSEIATFSYTVPRVAVTGVSITEGDQLLAVGETVSLTAVVEPAEAADKNVTWNSSNNNIAVVDETGQVTAVSEGEAMITVTTDEGDFTGSITVIVVPAAAPPQLLADTVNNKTGSAVAITFEDNVLWREAVTEVSIDGKALQGNAYTLNEGKLIFSVGCFTAAKDYDIVVKARGFMDAAVKQTIRTDAGSNPDLKAPPVLAADTRNARDIKVTFTDDAAWRAMFADITVNGVSIDGKYNWEEPGKISIDYHVFTAVGDYTVTVKANEYQDASVMLNIGAYLTIFGDGVSTERKYTPAQLEAMPQHEETYSVINTWPTKSWSVGKGVTLEFLLGPAQAGIKSGATLVTFFARDGYRRTLTVQELLNDRRYRFPNFMEGGGDGDGHLPGSAAGAIGVKPILALRKADGTTDPSSMNTVDTPLLMLGQRAVTEQTGPSFAKSVAEIKVTTGAIDKWAEPTAIPGSGTVPVGTEVKLSNTYMDEDKIYYTIDGSTPTLDSPIFNWIAKRWWPSRQDVLDEINHSIVLTKDTIIKAITIGPGKTNSDVAAFAYTVASDTTETVRPGEDKTIRFGEDVFMEIPAGASDKEIKIKIEYVETPPPLPAGYKLLSNVHEFSVEGQKNYSFAKKVTIGFRFDPGALSKDEIAAIHYYDEAQKRWVNIGGVIKDNIISVDVEHLTKFAVMALTAPVVSEKITPAKGGTVSFGREVTMEIPAGALAGTKAVEVKIECLNMPAATFAGYKLLSNVFEISIDGKSNYLFAKKVMLRFAFDVKALAKDETPAVYYFYPDGIHSRWVAIGGTVSNNTITIEVDHLTKFAVMVAAKTEELELTDIADHWACDYINKLVVRGVISGYPDGSFKPDNNITRAEFTAVLVKAFQLENQNGKNFTDADKHWARDFVAAAAANNIVSGYNQNIFGPDDLLTREQMAVMVTRAAKFVPSAGELLFTDSDNISGWARDPLVTAIENGIISGYPGNTFRPQSFATRAEAATVVAKILEKP